MLHAACAVCQRECAVDSTAHSLAVVHTTSPDSLCTCVENHAAMCAVPRAKLYAFAHADRPETSVLAERYGSVVPAQGSVVDLLVRARDKQTGLSLKAHQIVAQVSNCCAISG